MSASSTQRLFTVSTPQGTYPVLVERGAIARLNEFVSSEGRRPGKIFVISTRDVWSLHGKSLQCALRGLSYEVLFFAGGEENKRMVHVERFAEQMSEGGADRSSLVVAFGGGIVTDMGGFLASLFMRGVPIVQIPTTLLAQVDAAVGGKTGTNLVNGKNLVGTFHQPQAVIIDPAITASLPEREFRAGLYEIIKTAVIASVPLFQLMAEQRTAVLAQDAEVMDHIISTSVRIKAEVVSTDEREYGLRRILNFGHTFGHALESETKYIRFLHGEAVSWGMRAATYLACDVGVLDQPDSEEILKVLDAYGPIPSVAGVTVDALQTRLIKDKKTIQSHIHFVLPLKIGEVTVRTDIDPSLVGAAIKRALNDCQ